MEETFLRRGQIVRLTRMRLFLPLGLLATTIFVACSTSIRWDGQDPVKSTLPRSSNSKLAEGAGAATLTNSQMRCIESCESARG